MICNASCFHDYSAPVHLWYKSSQAQPHFASDLIMDSEIYLGKLVKLSIRKRSSPKVFISLLKQLLQKDPVSDNEILETLIELGATPKLEQARSSLQLSYAVHFACSGTAENERFMRLLSRASLESQRKYILYFKNNYKKVLPESILREFVNDGLAKYTKELSEKLRTDDPSQILKNVWTYTLLLWGGIIDGHLKLISAPVFKDLGIHIMTTLRAHGNPEMMTYFSNKANSILNALDLHKDVHAPIVNAKSKSDVPSTTSIKKSLGLNVSSKKVQHYFALKRFIWLNSRFRSWELDQLVERYFLFFKIPTPNIEAVVEEIVRAFFGGAITAVKLQEDAYVIFNWRNYIVTKLPQVLKESRVVHSQGTSESVEEILVRTLESYKDEAIMHMTSGGLQEQPYDLRKQFIRSCVYARIVSLEAMIRIFPEEGENVSQALITHQTEQLGQVDGLSSDMHSRLLDINPELTSLEESRLIDGFKGLASSNMFFLEAKQKRMHGLIHHSVDTLTREKNVEKLARLVLALSSALPAANYVFFHDDKGPFGVLDKVIAFIDSESFGVDADDSNFQEAYGQFGVLLSGVVLLSSTFGVRFDAVCVESSYTAEYINHFLYRLAEDLTDAVEGDSEQDKTIVHNYNRLVGDWTNALFDASNDGLSDDLIKSISVKQMYKLLLVIFQLAINARLAGALAPASLDNGIDYLSQNFLAPCAMAIMYWAAPKLGVHPASDAAADILLRIISTNLPALSPENPAFRVVLNAVGRHILARVHAVPEWRAVEKLALLARTVERHLDREYCTPGPPPADTPDMSSPPALWLADTVRRAVIHYTTAPGARKSPLPAPADCAAAAECWRLVRAVWPAIRAAELRRALVAEVEHAMRATAPGTGEEARVVADFLVFLAANSAGLDPRGLAGAGTGGGCALPAPGAVQYRFAASVDDHYASIFNGREPGEARATQSEAVDLDMDDLFDDVGDDLFGDVPAAGAGAESPRACRSAATVGDTYREVRRFAGLVGVAQSLEPDAADTVAQAAAGAMARVCLAREVDQWVHVARLH